MSERKVYFNITHNYGGVTCTALTPADDDGNRLQELAELEAKLEFHYWDHKEPDRLAPDRQVPPFLAECARRLAAAITERPDLVPTGWNNANQRRQICDSEPTSKSACNPFE